MGKWYEPDTTWTVFSVKDREDYVEKYIVPGRFHTGVPEDVVKAYETAEHLMALAWYHYPMYDEALKKLLGILEMAVKLRCQELDIPLVGVNKKGKKVNYRLIDLIEKICSLDTDRNFKYQLNKARNLRNHYAHPDAHSFAGGIVKQAVVPLINVLNRLFLNPQIISTANDILEQLKPYNRIFEQGLFILEIGDKKYLVTKAVVNEVLPIEGECYSLWVFLPVLEHKEEYEHAPPILFMLSDIEVLDQVLTGKEFKTGVSVKLYSSTNPLYQEKLKLHERSWNNLTDSKQEAYRHHMSRTVAETISKLQYQLCWSN